jgi:hypothetical protein
MIQYSNLQSAILGVVGSAVEYFRILRSVDDNVLFVSWNIFDDI